MSNYRRLISYIYAYEGGIKGKNIGFAKIEARGTQCKITVNVKKVYVGGNDIGVYLLAGEREIFLGNIFVRGGSGEFRTVVSVSDVEHSGAPMDQCYGLTVHDVENTWRSYTTIWEDAVAHAAELELNGSQPEKEETKNAVQEARIQKAIKEIEEEFPLKEEVSESSVTNGNGGAVSQSGLVEKSVYPGAGEIPYGTQEATAAGGQPLPRNQAPEASSLVENEAMEKQQSARRSKAVEGRSQPEIEGVAGKPQMAGEAMEEQSQTPGGAVVTVREQMKLLAENAREQSKAIVEMIRKQTEPFIESEKAVEAISDQYQGETAGIPMGASDSPDSVRDQEIPFRNPARESQETDRGAGEPVTDRMPPVREPMGSNQEPMRMLWRDAAKAGYGYSKMPAVEFASELMPDPNTDVSQSEWNQPWLSNDSQEPKLNSWEAGFLPENDISVYGNDTEADPSVNTEYGYAYFSGQRAGEEEERIFGTVLQEHGAYETDGLNNSGMQETYGDPQASGIQAAFGTKSYGNREMLGTHEIQETKGIRAVYGTREVPGIQEAYGTREIPRTQEAYNSPESRVIREVYDTPEIPVVQEAYDIRETPGTQEACDTTESQVTREVYDAPEIPVVQEACDTREIPEAGEAHAFSKTRVTQEAYAAPVTSEVQEAYDTLETPGAEEAYETQEKSVIRESREIQEASKTPVIQRNQAVPGSRPEPGNPDELDHLLEAEESEAISEEQLWDNLKRAHTKIMDFDYEKGCEILTIKPQDIGLLPRHVWVFGNNSFLLHGYYNYRYLILAKLFNTEGTPRYLLGVPGHFYSNEKYMASMFGFPDFVLSKNQPMEDGRFGYWYTDIQLSS